MIKNYSCLFLLALSLLIISCGDDDDGQQPSQKTGIISGTVKLFDEFGAAMPSSGNVNIQVQTGESGTSISSGLFQITQLSTGIYNLAYTKSGYGTYKIFNVEVNSGSNGTTLNEVQNLGAKSTTVISNLTSFFNVLDSTYGFGCSINPTPDSLQPRAFRLFFAKTSDVSSQNYLFTPDNSWVSTTGTGVLTGFQRENLYDNGFLQGDSVYFVGIGESIITNTYTDPVSQKKFYPNLNISEPSNIVGFVLE